MNTEKHTFTGTLLRLTTATALPGGKGALEKVFV
jgi:hypothetical protein